MKLRAELVIDILAGDYVDAASHQKTIEELLAPLKVKYPGAMLSLKERRERKSESDNRMAKKSYLISIPRAGAVR